MLQLLFDYWLYMPHAEPGALEVMTITCAAGFLSYSCGPTMNVGN